MGHYLLVTYLHAYFHWYDTFIGKVESFKIIYLTSLSLCCISSACSLHRYFEIKEKHLRIASANPFAVQKIEIATIEKIEVSYLAIRIFSQEFPNGQVYHMRKWPKKYFINHLAIHNCFKGEIELIDHLIKQDYFEEYYTKKAKSIR